MTEPITPIEYRIARGEDLPGILALYRELDPTDPAIDAGRAASVWAEVCASDRFAYFVALDGNTVASTANVSIIPNFTRGGRPFAIVENVVTDSRCRRRGIGRRVMEAAIDFARKRGCYKVVLLSGAARAEAHRFYESLGFSGSAKKGFDLRL
jgi:GNAT superfamily N-acetyltransferase